jgi:Transposase IS4
VTNPRGAPTTAAAAVETAAAAVEIAVAPTTEDTSTVAQDESEGEEDEALEFESEEEEEEEEEEEDEDEVPVVEANPPEGPTPVSVNHGREWFTGDTDINVNGPVTRRGWKHFCQYRGHEFFAACDDIKNNRRFTPYDFFMSMFPLEQLKFMVKDTSAKLVTNGHAKTGTGEILKWFGVTILMSGFEFGTKASLWEQGVNKHCKYIPAAHFGQTGMSRDRYMLLERYMSWSFQPTVREPSMSSEEYRWMLVKDFVDRFNAHRKLYFQPSSLIVVDESMSRWYGMGGHWINEGLPMYVAMERKPDDGCEIQNSACGFSGIMMRLKIVRSAEQEAADLANDGHAHNG